MAPIVAWRTEVLVPLVFLSSGLCLIVSAGTYSFWVVVCVAFFMCVRLGDCKTILGEAGTRGKGECFCKASLVFEADGPGGKRLQP